MKPLALGRCDFLVRAVGFHLGTKDSASEIDDPRCGTRRLIVNGNQIEHYEIALYGSLIAFARSLGFENALSMLEETLQEEKAADAKLTQIAQTAMNTRAAGHHASLARSAANRRSRDKRALSAGGLPLVEGGECKEARLWLRKPLRSKLRGSYGRKSAQMTRLGERRNWPTSSF